jgi:predicted Zn-dependent protease
MRGFADIQVRKADSLGPVSRAMPYYASAAFFDPDNYNLNSILGFRYAREGQYVAAAAAYRRLIDQGAATTLNYSILAEFLAKEGQNKAANDVFAEAISIYPNSIFLRVRYAVFREQRSQQSEADVHMAHARRINLRQANGWYLLLKGHAAKEIEPTDAESADKLLPLDASRYYLSLQEKMDAGMDATRSIQ